MPDFVERFRSVKRHHPCAMILIGGNLNVIGNSELKINLVDCIHSFSLFNLSTPSFIFTASVLVLLSLYFIFLQFHILLRYITVCSSFNILSMLYIFCLSIIIFSFRNFSTCFHSSFPFPPNVYSLCFNSSNLNLSFLL